MKAAALVVVLAPVLAFARAGGIDSQSCVGCHGGAGSQQTTLTLLPATFNPGDTITVRVRIAGAGVSGGLFLTANVGTFTTLSGQATRLLNGNVTQSSPKAASGGAVTFDVAWTAPATMGGVEFEAATLLANGNGQSSGDQAGGGRVSQAFGCAGVTYFRDLDSDGVGSAASGTVRDCRLPVGYSATDGDCDDFDNRRAPGKPESCNGLDDDCDAQVDEGLSALTTWPDGDGDGFGWVNGVPMSGCAGGNRASNDSDCDDANALINPGAMETCNQKDDDCDQQVDDGAQVRCGEGWCSRLGPTCNAADCSPGVPNLERCNAVDDDCDGVVDDGELCGAGALCVSGKCSAGDGGVGTVDGGAAGDGGTLGSPRGETTGSCSTAPELMVLLVAALLRGHVRRTPSPPSGERVGERGETAELQRS